MNSGGQAGPLCAASGAGEPGREGELVWISGLVTCPRQHLPPLPFRVSSPNRLRLCDVHRPPYSACSQPDCSPGPCRSALKCHRPSKAVPGRPCPNPNTTCARARTSPLCALLGTVPHTPHLHLVNLVLSSVVPSRTYTPHSPGGCLFSTVDCAAWHAARMQ